MFYKKMINKGNHDSNTTNCAHFSSYFRIHLGMYLLRLNFILGTTWYFPLFLCTKGKIEPQHIYKGY